MGRGMAHGRAVAGDYRRADSLRPAREPGWRAPRKRTGAPGKRRHHPRFGQAHKLATRTLRLGKGSARSAAGLYLRWDGDGVAMLSSRWAKISPTPNRSGLPCPDRYLSRARPAPAQQSQTRPSRLRSSTQDCRCNVPGPGRGPFRGRRGPASWAGAGGPCPAAPGAWMFTRPSPPPMHCCRISWDCLCLPRCLPTTF